MDTLRFRSLILALAVIAVASLCHMSGLFDETQARAATQGTYCLRIGRTYNVNGDEVKTGRWSEDGGGSWYE